MPVTHVNYTELPNFNTGSAIPAGLDVVAIIILFVVLLIGFRIALLLRRR